MEQNKFKVGDKVRIIKSDYNKKFYTRNIGKTSTIEKISVGVYPYILKDIDSCWGEQELELVKFTKEDLKIGDKLYFYDGVKEDYAEVISNSQVKFNNDNEIPLSYYTKNLEYKYNSLYDVIRIERTEVVFERKKEILDKQEKKYLKRVIAPFRNVVQKVVKHRIFGEDKEYIYFVSEKLSDCFSLPAFKEGAMYEGMEVSKEYTLEELGL